MRLIDADAFISEMNERIKAAVEWGTNAIANRDDKIKTRAEQAVATFCEASLTAKKMPTIDAVPVVHGHWENVEPAIWADVYATCSVCKKRQTLEKVRNFCPNCGAVMIEPTQTQHVESVGQRTQDVECVKVKPRRVR